MRPADPLVDWGWLNLHRGELVSAAGQHIELAVIAVAVGLAISLPVAVFAQRHRRVYGPVSWLASLLFTIPSLALFAFLVPYTGLTTTTSEVGLVSYTLLILIRGIVTGLDGVPADVKEAAVGMGYSRRQLLWRVEIPLALPVIIAAVRIAMVTTIGLVTVTALIGEGGLGSLILEGYRLNFATPSIAGAALSVALAVVFDVTLLQVQRVLVPWGRAGRSGRGGRAHRRQAAAQVGAEALPSLTTA